MRVDWDYFNKFNNISKKYLPDIGQGETKATQIVTAVSRLVYKWYNDGDVYDNTHYLSGFANDLSTYANWLIKYTDRAEVLNGISECKTVSDYDEILKELADSLLEENYLLEQNKLGKVDDIYTCDGTFQCEFNEYDDEW